MKLRCWPGCLAYITHPAMAGHMVEVMYLETQLNYTLPDGQIGFTAGDPLSTWIVRSISGGFPGVKVYESGVMVRQRCAMYAACGDKWLRPITPPPGAEITSTDAPADVLTEV